MASGVLRLFYPATRGQSASLQEVFLHMNQFIDGPASGTTCMKELMKHVSEEDPELVGAASTETGCPTNKL